MMRIAWRHCTVHRQTTQNRVVLHGDVAHKMGKTCSLKLTPFFFFIFYIASWVPENLPLPSNITTFSLTLLKRFARNATKLLFSAHLAFVNDLL